ncbi:putative MPP superfamily phosphohydrolase [Bacillus ectoiniformans]|nr:putative MPP superfamily phosphohydrolase [Bacillus ectoiniformans]
MFKEGHRNEVKSEEVKLHSFTELKPFNLFFISDIHRRQIAHSIIDKVQGKADVIVIGGDLTEKGVPIDRIKQNLVLLQKVAPVFFVWGNNDYECPDLKDLLESCNVTILKNGSAVLNHGTQQIYLLGVDDASVGTIDKPSTFSHVPNEGCKILISHNPVFANRLSEGDSVSLFLSGHTHGGQIRLFHWGLYPNGGWSERAGMRMLVSNGYGTSGVPLRLGAKAETHLITISKEL